MFKKLRGKILKYLLLFLFLGFFGSISFFRHVHVVDGVTIVHSHPGLPSHNHNTRGFQLIQFLNDYVITGITIYIICNLLLSLRNTILFREPIPGNIFREKCGSNTLRGPPVLNLI